MLLHYIQLITKCLRYTQTTMNSGHRNSTDTNENTSARTISQLRSRLRVVETEVLRASKVASALCEATRGKHFNAAEAQLLVDKLPIPVDYANHFYTEMYVHAVIGGNCESVAFCSTLARVPRILLQKTIPIASTKNNRALIALLGPMFLGASMHDSVLFEDATKQLKETAKQFTDAGDYSALLLPAKAPEKCRPIVRKPVHSASKKRPLPAATSATVNGSAVEKTRARPQVQIPPSLGQMLAQQSSSMSSEQNASKPAADKPPPNKHAALSNGHVSAKAPKKKLSQTGKSATGEAAAKVLQKFIADTYVEDANIVKRNCLNAKAMYEHYTQWHARTSEETQLFKMQKFGNTLRSMDFGEIHFVGKRRSYRFRLHGSEPAPVKATRKRYEESEDQGISLLDESDEYDEPYDAKEFGSFIVDDDDVTQDESTVEDTTHEGTYSEETTIDDQTESVVEKPAKHATKLPQSKSPKSISELKSAGQPKPTGEPKSTSQPKPTSEQKSTSPSKKMPLPSVKRPAAPTETPPAQEPVGEKRKHVSTEDVNDPIEDCDSDSDIPLLSLKRVRKSITNDRTTEANRAIVVV